MSLLTWLLGMFGIVVVFFVVLEVMPRLWRRSAQLLDKWLGR